MLEIVRKKKKERSVPELLSGLKESENFMCSPVSYLTELLEAYLSGNVTMETFCAKYERETKEAQFVFSMMPPVEIQNNKRLFAKEFSFANKITSLVLSAESTEESFHRALCAYINVYLST